MTTKYSRKRVLEFLKTFLPVRTRLVNCICGERRFQFWVTKNDDLRDFTVNDNFDSYEGGSLVYWSERCSGGIAVDIGAYTGIYSIMASTSGATDVFAFEPNKFSSEQLKRNLASNDILNVRVSNVALSHLTGTDYLLIPKIRFHLHARKHGSGVQLASSPINRNLKRWKRGNEVAISTLDAQIPSELHSKVSIIKIDVEGAELSVLKGSTRILSKSNCELIIESLEDSTTQSIIDYLATYSFKLKNELSKNLIFSK